MEIRRQEVDESNFAAFKMFKLNTCNHCLRPRQQFFNWCVQISAAQYQVVTDDGCWLRYIVKQDNTLILKCFIWAIESYLNKFDIWLFRGIVDTTNWTFLSNDVPYFNNSIDCLLYVLVVFKFWDPANQGWDEPRWFFMGQATCWTIRNSMEHDLLQIIDSVRLMSLISLLHSTFNAIFIVFCAMRASMVSNIVPYVTS